MSNPGKDYLEYAARTFAAVFTIHYSDYNAINMRSGKYFCLQCAGEVRRFKNCTKCGNSIDWKKGIISPIALLFLKLKGDESDTDYRATAGSNDKVKGLSDDELIQLIERVFDNMNQSELDLIKASNWEADGRFLHTNGLFARLFNRGRYNKLKKARDGIEIKAKAFVLAKTVR